MHSLLPFDEFSNQVKIPHRGGTKLFSLYVPEIGKKNSHKSWFGEHFFKRTVPKFPILSAGDAVPNYEDSEVLDSVA